MFLIVTSSLFIRLQRGGGQIILPTAMVIFILCVVLCIVIDTYIAKHNVGYVGMNNMKVPDFIVLSVIPLIPILLKKSKGLLTVGIIYFLSE